MELVPRDCLVPRHCVLELVELWLANQAPTSAAAYRGALVDFAAALGGDLERVLVLLLAGPGEANALALGFRATMIARDLSPATINLRLSALRSLVAAARRLGLVAWVLEVAGVRSRRYRDTRGPSRSVVAGMLSIAGPRDGAIVWLLAGLGLRRGEVTALDREHVDLAGGLLWVTGKGEREASPLEATPPVCAALATWLGVRGDAPGPLFLEATRGRTDRRRLSGRSVARVVGRLGRAVGVQVAPHGLRHMAITEALHLTNGDVRSVREFSRHRDVSTVLLYDDARHGLAGKIRALVAASLAAAQGAR